MLPRSNKLPKSDVTAVMRSGHAAQSGNLLLKYKRTTDIPRFAFVVSTKVDARSAVRNRIRRILREEVRRHLQEIPAIDGVFIVRRAAPSVADEALELLYQLR